jgi:hypothetical protein
MLSKTSPFGRRLGLGSYQPGGMGESRAGEDFLRAPAPATDAIEVNGVHIAARDGAAIRNEAAVKTTALEEFGDRAGGCGVRNRDARVVCASRQPHCIHRGSQ